MSTISETPTEQQSLRPLQRPHQFRPAERIVTTSVDLRLLDYVSDYDENLMCPICRCPFIDPVMLADCDHHFCRDCITQCWSTGTAYAPLAHRGQCPTCRAPARLSTRAATSKILANIIGELLVKCPRHDEGCLAVVKRGEVQDHVHLYCGFSPVECMSPGCRELARRRDTLRGCVHFLASCVDCRAEMQVGQLDRHWEEQCPDREVACKHCDAAVFYRQLDSHYETCPVRPVACPGKDLGCGQRDNRAGVEEHARNCVFARLVPLIAKHQERLDEQEAAQRQMSRKLQVLESGYAALQHILDPQHDARLGDANSTLANMHRDDLSTDEGGAPNAPNYLTHVGGAMPMPHRNHNVLSVDAELAGMPPPATDGGPYVSPLHHLLSMHEALRDEMSRISLALSELEGRHSMQILNENLRTREEISYLAAQVGGLQRQVHWLTSTQLQRQQTRAGAAGGSANVDASTVDGVVDAVSSAATALRGAAQMAGFAPGQERRGREGVRRGASEEGRTKL